MLRVTHLQVVAGNRTLLTDVNISWQAGALASVLGPNGAGKSSLLNHICGVALTQRQCVFFNGEDVLSLPPLKRATRMASIAQHDDADLETRVIDRIAHGLYARKMSSRLKTTDERRLVEQIADTLGIADLLSRRLFTLSGGQRKKVHIARGLVDDNAQVYILDEPDASLDAESRDHLMRVLKKICEAKKLVIVSLHHNDLADLYCDHQFLIEPNISPSR